LLVVFSVKLIGTGRKRGFLAASINNSEAKRAQHAVQQSEEKFSKVFRLSPIPLSLSRVKDGLFLDVNESFEEVYGFTKDEVVGRTAPDIGLWTPSDHEDIVRALRSKEGIHNRECQIRSKNGIRRAGLISVEVVEIDDQPCALISTVDITALKQVQEALLSEKTLSDAVFGTLPGVLFLLDENGNLIRWNKQAERFTGYSARELLEHNIFDLHCEPHRVRELFRNIPEGGHAEFETELCQKSGLRLPFYCTVGFVSIDNKHHFVAVGIDLTERRRVEKERLGLSARLITAQDEERSRIARELHDDVSQKVALLGIQLDQLLQSTSLNVRLKAQFSEMKSRIMELASALHDLSREIHPSNLSRLGFRAALQGLCRDMTERGLLVHLICESVPNSLPPQISLCLFRVAQESLNNVMKHSGVREAKVDVAAETGRIRMRITDRGKGFDAASKDFQPGLGILSMRERLLLIGGEFSARKRPEGGMEIEARVQFNSAQIPLSA
jgi:PAS domain S-box-containing protein